MHWRLRKIFASFCSGECAHFDAVDGPDYGRGRPVDGVGMELCLGTGGRDIFGHAVVGIPFPEVISLDLVIGGTRAFPIDFVKVARKEEETADYTLSFRSLDDIFDTAKEEVEG